MPAGSGDGSLENHGGSYFVRGKERQPASSSAPLREGTKGQPEVPENAIERAIEAAKRHFERLTKPTL